MTENVSGRASVQRRTEKYLFEVVGKNTIIEQVNASEPSTEDPAAPLRNQLCTTIDLGDL